MKKIESNKLGLKELVSMGVGGMVGGGIFSVLGLSVLLAGHAAPLVFALGGFIAFLTGISYSKLGFSFRSDGGSFTYLEHAFSNKNIAGVGGWLLLVGYVGTLSLYSYTFGAYGAAMLGSTSGSLLSRILESLILATFLVINLLGTKLAGFTEDLIVLVKVLILSIFSFTGLFYIKTDYVLPVFNKSISNILMGAALIFVAYEGFELIPNAIGEMKDPGKNLMRGIIISITVTTFIYLLVSFVAIGNLLSSEINRYKEYALAVAAKPFLGQAGFLLIGLGALLSTASAINSTMFGTARLGTVISQEKELPKVFSLKERTRDIPWVSLIVITAITALFVNIADLAIISSFASSVFLLIFAFINLSALRLRKRIGGNLFVYLAGFLLSSASLIVLTLYLWHSNKKGFLSIFIIYIIVIVAELVFSERRILRSRR